MRHLLPAVLLVLIPATTSAQATRFEVGQRLRLFERTLDRHHSAEARRRAMDTLVKTTPTFFSGQLGEVAALLDRARWLLVSDREPAEEVRWAESLFVRPQARLIDTSTTELGVKVLPLYRSPAKRPDGAEVSFTLLAPGGKPTSRRVTTTGAEAKLPLGKVTEGEHTLRHEIRVNGKVVATGEQMISVVRDKKGRLTQLAKAREALADRPASTEKATLGQLLSLLEALRVGKSLETSYPAAALLAQAEALAEAARTGKSYHGPERPGSFWMTLASGEAIRIQVPENLRKDRPVPVVVALHGAWGSENLFFDGYGDGLVAKLARERGWLVVATRSPLFAFSGGPNVVHIIDALAKVYPLDTRKVFLVGHSMGAAQAVALAGQRPERFAAVAALGGGGRARESAGLAGLPFFVGVGARDFAVTGAKRLAADLTKSGAKNVTLRVYDDVEHLIVVQMALPDVFTFFDRASKR